jgi:hypothetical protein
MGSVCPTTVRVAQRLEKPMPGWEESRSQGASHLENISIYEGHPSQLAALVPDSEEKRGAGRSAAIWHLSPSSYGYWIECSYTKTDVVISRRISDRAVRCELVVDTTSMRNGRAEVVDVVCR